MKQKKKSVLGIAGNQNAAAAKTGLTLDQVKALKAAGSPGWKKNNSIDCDALTAFAAKNPDLLKAHGGSNSFQVAKVLDTSASTEFKKAKTAMLLGKLIPIESVRVDWTKMVVSCRIKMASAAASISTEAGMKFNLSQLQINELRQMVERSNRSVQTELHKGEYGKTNCPFCEKEIL